MKHRSHRTNRPSTRRATAALVVALVSAGGVSCQAAPTGADPAVTPAATPVASASASSAASSAPSPAARAAGGVAAGMRGDFDIGGRSLYLECDGEGSPTIILEAGMTGDIHTWGGVGLPLSEMTRVCRYDRANIGGSDPAPTPRTAADATADLHALMAAADVEPPYVLVGFSWGGLLAQHFAATYPDEVVGLMLLESNHYDEARRYEAVMTPEQIAEDRAMAAEISEGMDVYASYDEVRAIVDRIPDVPLVVVSSTGKGDWGTLDATVMDALRAELQASLTELTSQGRQVLAEESGHWVADDQPELVIDGMARLLADVAASPVP